MCKHVAGKIVKQYYRHSIQCHLSVPISGRHTLVPGPSITLGH